MNHCDSGKRSPLHYACGTGNVPLAFRIVELGANVNILDLNGHSAVWEALKGGSAQDAERSILVQKLLQSGSHVDPTATDNQGTSLIHHAIASRWHTAAAVVVEHSRAQGMEHALGDVAWNAVAENATGTSPLLADMPTSPPGAALLALDNAWREAAEARGVGPFLPHGGSGWLRSAESVARHPDGSTDYAGVLLQRLCTGTVQ